MKAIMDSMPLSITELRTPLYKHTFATFYSRMTIMIFIEVR